MHIIKISDVKAEEKLPPGAFIGEVQRRFLVDEKTSKTLVILDVSFKPGGRSNIHVHAFDHALYVLQGKGIVATKDEERVIEPGMIAVVPAGEVHWHGATKDSPLRFLAISTPGETKQVGKF